MALEDMKLYIEKVHIKNKFYALICERLVLLMKFEKYFNHTILKPEATNNEVRVIYIEAIQHEFASVCI